MISLAQTALMGIAGYIAREHGHPERDRAASRRVSLLGLDPTLALVLAIVAHDGHRTRVRRGRGAELRHLLPDAHADLCRDRVLLLRPGDAVRRLLAHRRHQPVHARVRRRHRGPPDKPLLHRARRRARRLRAHPLRGRARRSGSRCRAFATSPCAWRRSGTTSRCIGRSRSASPRSSPRSRACSTPGGRARSRRRRRPRRDDRAARDRASSAGSGASRAPGSEHSPSSPSTTRYERGGLDSSSAVPGLGGSFNTVIGLIFLAIVIVSPDGLMGLWNRIWEVAGRRGGGPPQVAVGTQRPSGEGQLLVNGGWISRNDCRRLVLGMCW